MTDRQLRDEVMAFLVAGHETTALASLLLGLLLRGGFLSVWLPPCVLAARCGICVAVATKIVLSRDQAAISQ
jgi:hypothetical protein